MLPTGWMDRLLAGLDLVLALTFGLLAAVALQHLPQALERLEAEPEDAQILVVLLLGSSATSAAFALAGRVLLRGRGVTAPPSPRLAIWAATLAVVLFSASLVGWFPDSGDPVLRPLVWPAALLGATSIRLAALGRRIPAPPPLTRPPADLL